VTAQENALYHALAGYVARHADAVVTNSRATAELVGALGGDPIIIPPGVDLDRFRPSPRPRDRRVLYLGGRQHHKGYDRALGVADTLVGPGLKEVGPADVPALIAEHDIVLVPSRAEPFGLVAAEAIASGRWVVAASVDGLREVVTEGVNGSLVGNDDFVSAVASVPDYDPLQVASTATRFSLREHQRAMAALWDKVAHGA
jgi:glycosyltransferase involved in cell wall biosynthesis